MAGDDTTNDDTPTPPPTPTTGLADETATVDPRAQDERHGTGPTELAPDSMGGAQPPPPRLVLPDRYEDLGLLGRGGFGEVRLVLDRRLDRPVAMKLLSDPRYRARFLAEIKLTAGLHHPGIVPVHDYDELPDGRLWFTMDVVKGRDLGAVLNEAFALPSGVTSVTRRRLLEVFARVCDTVAYAHSRGVIHRDLKPKNVMVGDYGRVLVVDWGIARRLGAVPEAAPSPSPSPGGGAPDLKTMPGDRLGTPGYMAPEQVSGEVALHRPATDVYALGAILYYVLSGTTVSSSGPAQHMLAGAAGVPADLVAICERAMARDPSLRYADAGALVAEIDAFMVGAQRRERALAELAKASARLPEIAHLRAQAEGLRAEARQILDRLRPSDPADAKLPGWKREDEAERLCREASLAETLWEQEVHGALAIDHDLPEGHAALSTHYRDRLVEAERARRPAEAARMEVLLRAHDRGRYAAFLSGAAALTLVTDPPGARVTLHRYATRTRRLVPEVVRDLGPTPIVDRPVAHGSYLLRVSAPGRAGVAYPVLVERGQRWDGCPPGSATPYPIPLPRVGELQADEVYVPAGWCWTGDPDAVNGLPRRRVWVDGFVVGRFPVTNEEYLAFLNDLCREGREEEALSACPRPSRGYMDGADAQLSYDRGPDGRFQLKAVDTGEVWGPRGPAVLMSWHGAMAYARWLAARSGLPYRLLCELEREKAAVGADGRRYPWGDHFDPTWARMLDSTPGNVSRVEVDGYPEDESPYGLRGAAGNSRDFCLDAWTLAGPELRAGRLVLSPAPLDGDEYRSVRGGSWVSVQGHCWAAARFACRPGERFSAAGLRIARSFP